MVITACLCPWPPILVRDLTGRDPVIPGLRQACRTAVRRLVDAQPEVIAVAGPANSTRTWDQASRLDPHVFALALSSDDNQLQSDGQHDPALPPSLDSAPCYSTRQATRDRGSCWRWPTTSRSTHAPGSARCEATGLRVPGCSSRVMAAPVVILGSLAISTPKQRRSTLQRSKRCAAATFAHCLTCLLASPAS